MTGDSSIERALPSILEDLVAGPAPDYTDFILARTVATTQRPGWVFPERWFPMSAVTQRLTAAPRVPWRTIGVIALLVLALAAAVFIIGSQQRPLPAPYGPAENGLVAFVRDGDAYVGDPATGDERQVTTGPEVDGGVYFSRDGTRLVIFREAPAGSTLKYDLWIANVDGSGLHKLTDAPLVDTFGGDWSGDGRWFVMSSVVDGRWTMTVFDLDSGESHVLNVGMDAMQPTFRPPDSAELLFRGDGVDGEGIYVVRADGSSAPRRVVGPTSGLQAVHWAPDGKQIAYSQAEATGRVFTRIVGADGKGDHALSHPPGVIYQVSHESWGSIWSPDGKSLLVARSYWGGPNVPAIIPQGTAGGQLLAILSVDGSVPDWELTPRGFSFGSGWGWSPDGSKVITSIEAPPGGLQVIDVATREVTTFDGWASQSWQRVAAE